MKKLFVYATVASALYSCVNSKKAGEVYIVKNQAFMQRVNSTNAAAPVDSMFTKTLLAGKRARLTLPVQPADYLQLKFTQATNASDFLVTDSALAAVSDPPAAGIYVPVAADSTPPKDKNIQIFRGKSFRYIEFKHAFQTLAIPIKFRPGIRDSIANTASASFNVGFAYAFKFTDNRYRRLYAREDYKSKQFAHSFTKYSYAFAPFLGPAIIDLKSANTDGKVVKDRSVVGLTTGAMGVIGVNEVNAGIAIGFDLTVGPQAGAWIYNKRPWIGIVIALDIIK